MMRGTRPGKRPRPSKRSEVGRVCAAEDCATTLSIYNAKDVCWQHADIAFPNFRGKRLHPREG